jgi:hypothetical protein
MKQFIKRIVFNACNFYFGLRFKRFLRTVDSKSNVYIIDIDNTLAHTWPSLQHKAYQSENKRYRSLAIFIGMRNFILNKIKKHQKVVFITARSFFCYPATKNWLFETGLSGPGIELVLVARPNDKLKYINTVLNSGHGVIYIDDLSYNHENGEMKLYSDLIRQVRELPIQYYGIDEIELINSKP